MSSDITGSDPESAGKVEADVVEPPEVEEAELTEAINEEEADEALVAGQGGLFRNSSMMAVGSIVSRLTGIARDMSLTAALGITITADAFALGNSLPSIIYVLVIGGALNAIFVPQFVRRMKDDADGGKAYTDSLLTVAGIILVVVTFAAVAAAPLIVKLYATPSFTDAQTELAVTFARFCLPQIFFFGLYTMLAQVLNARGHFAMPMFAPMVNNVIAIATYLTFIWLYGTTVAGEGELTFTMSMWLGIGTTLGIIAQACVLIPVLSKAGYTWKFSRTWRGMGMRKAGRLAGWTLGLVAVSQLGYVFVSRLATQANVAATEAGGPVGLAAYNRAYLVFMIPHGIVTVSIVTAQLPGLSRAVHANRLREAGAEIGHTMRLIAVVITPIALALVVAAEPLSALLFNYGAASAESAAQLGVVMSAFMIGLIPFTLYYVIQRGWYAMENTRTPFVFAVLMNAIFIALGLLFFWYVTPGASQVNALAFAFSLANWVMFLVAWPAIRRSYGFIDGLATFWTLFRVALAGLAGLFLHVFVLELFVGPFFVGDSKLLAAGKLATTSLSILIGFLLAAWVLRIRELRELVSWIALKLPIPVSRKGK